MASAVKTISIKIDGIELSTRPGTTVLEAAQTLGIDIPTLCHLKGLAPLATCRVCQVEETKRGVLLAACATPVSEGMDVRTDTERVREARKTILELLLASHPETCLVCDRHGTCLLRNVASRLGIGAPSIERIPLPVRWEHATEFIVRDLQKCILCGRCIKVCQEVVVQGAIDYHKRGFNTVVAMPGELPLSAPDCIQCAVCVAVCPTGALDHRIKPYRRAAPHKSEIVCQHCGCGCKLEVELLDGTVVGRMPWSAEGALPMGCARGVYENDALKSGERVLSPLAKKGDSFVPCQWDEAIESAVESLRGIVSTGGPGSIAFWASPLASCEEGHLLQKLAREVLGSPNINVAGSGLLRTGMIMRRDNDGAGYPSLCTLDDLVESDLIVVIGIGVSREAPAVDFAIRRAVRTADAKMILIDEGQESPLARWASIRISSKEEMISLTLAYIGKTILSMVSKCMTESPPGAGSRVSYVPGATMALTGATTEEIIRASEEILSSQKITLVLGFSGDGYRPSADCEEAAFLAQASWHQTRIKAGILPAGAFMNEVGLARAGVSPDVVPDGDDPRRGTEDGKNHGQKGFGIGSSLEKIRSRQIRGLVLFGYDTLGFFTRRASAADLPLVVSCLRQLDYLLVVDSRRRSGLELASCIMPMSEHEERKGTFIGIDGVTRLSPAAARPQGESLSGEEILSKLMEGFGHGL
jgi:formate dehydrogenase alpha subunit